MRDEAVDNEVALQIRETTRRWSTFVWPPSRAPRLHAALSLAHLSAGGGAEAWQERPRTWFYYKGPCRRIGASRGMP